ncbi:hypothetical protein M422DRAFT_255170 [Sphaerobolus stellatus SS14]|uniref:Peptide hydrolase n=1 Tax=Sphaerobolus stellatus (strain SS14) TaxID=990650 RepID=A0A0C9VTH5_SPHS4|nr:hypothetical protein M422DRAFT_255170 [Sphaerobolus stellatus SS14]
MTAKMWRLLPSLLAIVLLFFGASLWVVNKYYGESSIRCCKVCTERDFLILPTPVGSAARDDLSLSEADILGVAQHLSETIGYRTIGTKEHPEGDAWMVEQVQQLKKGATAFEEPDIMGYRVYKNYYVNLSNIIVRLSNGIAAGKEHALLVSSHIDSAPPSPGGADNALLVTLSNCKDIQFGQ